MHELLFLDVETTGLDAEDRLLEVTFTVENTLYDERFKPPLPIKLGAMATHHITEKMVEDKPTFEGSELQQNLMDYTMNDYILVAHNAPFDMKMLDKEGVVFKRYIDTLKLSHYMDKEGDMESHSLQYLRYYHGIELPEAIAHTGSGDVAVLEEVYKILAKDLTLEEQVEISEMPVLYKRMNFGKAKGEKVSDMLEREPSYMRWVYETKVEKEQDENWAYTFEHYSK